jgi:hypothetical protein
MLRPSDRRTPAPAAAPIPDGVPLFHMVDHSPPRASALLPGFLLSLGFFALVAFVVSHPGTGRTLLIGSRDPSPRPLSVDRNSISAGDPTTKVKVGEKPPDPWREFAESYFRIMPVLRALDSDHDFLISRAEIARAPEALRTLDLDHDGKLSPLECGFSLGRHPENVSSAELKALGAEFMHSQPVLAALDADGDGEISAAEIGNAPAALLTLDISRDGVLAPPEFAPESVVKRILGR